MEAGAPSPSLGQPRPSTSSINADNSVPRVPPPTALGGGPDHEDICPGSRWSNSHTNCVNSSDRTRSPSPNGRSENKHAIVDELMVSNQTTEEEVHSVNTMIGQPETRPISQEQLVAEVKGIYAGLVMCVTYSFVLCLSRCSRCPADKFPTIIGSSLSASRWIAHKVHEMIQIPNSTMNNGKP
jgi:hypothetical protein